MHMPDFRSIRLRESSAGRQIGVTPHHGEVGWSSLSNVGATFMINV
jgi:hypothetical protein